MMPAAFSRCVFLSRAQRMLMAQGTAIFTYHKIGAAPQRTRDPFLYTTPTEFERQLTLLRNAQYHPAGLDSIGENAPERAFVVTFDDGFRNVFERGLEILARCKVPAIQFIVSGAMGKANHWDIAKGDVAEPLMDAVQIKQWLAAGNQIGSHSMSHRNLKTLAPAETREEITASKKFLEDTFGVEVCHFCYPFGGWSSSVRETVIQAGYKTACSVEFGVNPPGADRFSLRRIIPLSQTDLFRKILHRLLRKVSGR